MTKEVLDKSAQIEALTTITTCGATLNLIGVTLLATGTFSSLRGEVSGPLVLIGSLLVALATIGISFSLLWKDVLLKELAFEARMTHLAQDIALRARIASLENELAEKIAASQPMLTTGTRRG
jgi:hypothetical protein